MPRWIYWILAVAWMTVIFWLSQSPDARGGSWLLSLIPFADKLAHGAAFGILALLVFLASGRFVLAVVIASLYGVSDEIHQYFVPGRSADALDWLADTTGAILMLLLVKFLTRRKKHPAKAIE